MPLPMYPQPSNTSKPSQINSVIAIAAGKGGVGKSTVAVNLALALHNLGYAVGVMDTDIYGPSVRKMLPEDKIPTQKGEWIIPAICSGIKMISMAYFRKENEASVVRAPIANGIIKQFVHNVAWGSLDFLLIDFPPGTGDVQLTLSQQANLCGAIMVTTPQEVAVMDVRKAIDMFEHVNIPLVGIIENMSYYQNPATKEKAYLFGKNGGEKLAHQKGVPYLGAVPIDPLLCRNGDLGQSIFSTADTSDSAQIFLHLAKQLVDHTALLKEQTAKALSTFEIQWKDMAAL